MRVASFAEIAPEFIARAHRMVWCNMAAVAPDGRQRTRIVHPVWEGDTACMASLRVGSKADDIDCNPLGCATKKMFGRYDFPHLTMLRLKRWKIRLSVAGDPAALWV